MLTISHLIPLYRSRRFFDIIAANTVELAGPDVEIILADRNGDFEFCDALRDRFRNLPNVQVLCDQSNVSWVENIGRLIQIARGKYLQILPHDDSTSKHAVAALCAAIDSSQDAVLAYGRVRAFDLDGNHKPGCDNLNAREDPQATGWTLEDVLPMYWIGRFGGAFKGVIRTAAAQNPKHVIRATPTTLHSERAWLFSLALAGRFVFVPTDMLHKRYYPTSTHRSWKFTPEAVDDAANLMVDVLRITLEDLDIREYAIRDVVSNAAWRTHWMRHPEDGKFTYRPLAHPGHFREYRLGWAGQSV